MWKSFILPCALHFLLSFRLYECNIGVHLGYIPLLPDFRSACSLDNVVDTKSYISLADCLDWCEKTSLCVMIHYSPHSTMCVLKEAGTPTPSPDGRCISIEVSSNSSVTLGACASRPCNGTSVCVQSESSEDIYTCRQTYCKPPPAIQNAQHLSNVLRKIGESTVYKCNSQYSGFHGSPRINCTGNGTWTETSFQCYPDCPDVPVLATADVAVYPRAPYITNSTILYECKPRYYNITPAVITCDENGVWTFFECLPHCDYGNVPQVNNGMVLPDDEYTIYKPATLVCATGYYLFPDQPNITCNRDGRWSSPKSSCYKYCTPPADPSNGYITSQITQNEMKNGTKVNYSCHSNYYHHPTGTSEELVCNEYGRWYAPTECYRYCGDPPSVSIIHHGQYFKEAGPGPPYTVHSTAKYECVTGTKLQSPTKKLTCNYAGNWDGQVICCAITHSYNEATGSCELFGRK